MSLDGLPLICICVLAGFLSYYGEHGVPPYVMIIDRDEDQIASLVSVVEGYSRDIGMEFGMEKCAVLTIEGGKRVKREGMELPSGEVMKEVDENGYKYLGVLQTEEVMDKEMKRRVRDEYLRRVRLLAKS